MKQFFQASDIVFADIEQRAHYACVVFHSQEMPPSTVPAQSRIGFEIDPTTGQATLLVDQCRYYGSDETVRGWLHEGELRFDNFAQLQHWVQRVLPSAYDGTSPSVKPASRRLLLPPAPSSAFQDIEHPSPEDLHQ